MILCGFLSSWNINGENAIDYLACFAAMELGVHEFYDLLGFEISFLITIVLIPALVATNELELEVLDIFIT